MIRSGPYEEEILKDLHLRKTLMCRKRLKRDSLLCILYRTFMLAVATRNCRNWCCWTLRTSFTPLQYIVWILHLKSNAFYSTSIVAINLCCHKCFHLAGWNCTAQGYNYIIKLIVINITIAELGGNLFIPLPIRRIWCYTQVNLRCRLSSHANRIGSSDLNCKNRWAVAITHPGRVYRRGSEKTLPPSHQHITGIQAEKDARSDHAFMRCILNSIQGYNTRGFVLPSSNFLQRPPSNQQTKATKTRTWPTESLNRSKPPVRIWKQTIFSST